MSRRLTLLEIRRILLDEALDTWITASECQRYLGLPGNDFYKVALVLERLAVDGLAEIKTPGSQVRRFRLKDAAA